MKRWIVFICSIVSLIARGSDTDVDISDTYQRMRDDDYRIMRTVHPCAIGRFSPLNTTALAVIASNVAYGALSINCGPLVVSINAVPLLYSLVKRWWQGSSSPPPNYDAPRRQPLSTPEYIPPPPAPYVPARTVNPSLARRAPEQHLAQTLQELTTHEPVRDKIASMRAARTKALHAGTKRTKRPYILNVNLEHVRTIKKDRSGLATLRGTPIQLTLYDHIITNARANDDSIHTYTQRHSQTPLTLLTTSNTLLDDAWGHTARNQLTLASHLIDLSTHVSNLAHRIYHYSIKPMALGTADAVRETAQGVTQVVRHPIASTKELVIAIHKTAVCAARCVSLCADLALYDCLQMHTAFTATQTQLKAELHPLLTLYDAFKQLPSEDKVRTMTHGAVNLLINHYGMKGLGRLCSSALTQAQSIRQLPTVHLSLAPYAKLSPATITVAEHAEYLVMQRMNTLLHFSIEEGEAAFNNALKQMKNLPNVVHYEEELIDLRLMFDNTVRSPAAHLNKFIELDYDHIFKPTINFTGTKIIGFHHDLYGLLEQSGFYQLKNIKDLGEGFYEANMYFQGISQKKSFFPKHWSRTQIIETIIKTANEGLIEREYGRRKIVELPYQDIAQTTVKSNIIIRTIIEDEYKIITAYPELNN